MSGLERDLTGLRFNALTVVRMVGKVQHGRNMVKVWSCVCICGNELEVDQASLKKGQVPACKTCRRGPCVICSKPITNPNYAVKRNTCSDVCRKEQIRAKHRRRYHKQIELDPEHNKKRYQERLAKDPDMNKKRYQRWLKRLYAMPPTIRQEIINKQNEYSQIWQSNYVKDLKANHPEDYQQYRERINYYMRNLYKNKMRELRKCAVD